MTQIVTRQIHNFINGRDHWLQW